MSLNLLFDLPVCTTGRSVATVTRVLTLASAVAVGSPKPFSLHPVLREALEDLLGER